MDCQRIKKIKISGDCRDWQQLDCNILQTILRKADPMDLICGVSLVCRWWRTSCWDVLFWKDHETLDLTAMHDLIIRRRGRVYHHFWLGMAINCVMSPLMMEDRQTLLRNVIVPNYPYLYNEHVLYISRRSPRLKRLVLPDSTLIAGAELAEAVQNWKELEEISIGPIRNDEMRKVITPMGSFCKNLRVVGISGMPSPLYFQVDVDNVAAIAKSWLKLTVFCLKNVTLHKNGIRKLMDECKELHEVSFTRCRREEEKPISPMYRISAKIEKCKASDHVSVRWCVDSEDGLYVLEEVLDYLWSL